MSSAAAAPKKARAAKKAAPAKDVAPKAKRGEGQRVSTHPFHPCLILTFVTIVQVR